MNALVWDFLCKKFGKCGKIILNIVASILIIDCELSVFPCRINYNYDENTTLTTKDIPTLNSNCIISLEFLNLRFAFVNREMTNAQILYLKISKIIKFK